MQVHTGLELWPSQVSKSWREKWIKLSQVVSGALHASRCGLHVCLVVKPRSAWPSCAARRGACVFYLTSVISACCVVVR